MELGKKGANENPKLTKPWFESDLIRVELINTLYNLNLDLKSLIINPALI